MKATKQKIGIVFYASFYEATKQLSAKKRLAMYDAIMKYGFDEEEPTDLPEQLKALFELIKPQIDASKRRYAKACQSGKYGVQGASSGIKGGRPPKRFGLESIKLTEEDQASFE